MTLCKIRNRINEGLCGAGQHLLDHYGARGQLPGVEGVFGGRADMGPDVLRVGRAACGACAGPWEQVPGLKSAFRERTYMGPGVLRAGRVACGAVVRVRSGGKQALRGCRRWRRQGAHGAGRAEDGPGVGGTWHVARGTWQEGPMLVAAW